MDFKVLHVLTGFRSVKEIHLHNELWLVTGKRTSADS